MVDKILEHMYIAQLKRAMTESWGLLACSLSLAGFHTGKYYFIQ